VRYLTALSLSKVRLSAISFAKKQKDVAAILNAPNQETYSLNFKEYKANKF